MPTRQNIPDTDFDAIVIGGSYAGLSAATQLARARRRVLVVDADRRRNRFARHSHGFLTQDGTEGATIAAIGREQLARYATVSFYEGTAEAASGNADAFTVKLDNGETRSARRLVLATGVIDELPAIEGLAERWGRSAFSCPYCDGYELQQGRIGVLATGALSMHQALMLPDWGITTLFLNDAFAPDDAQRESLQQRGVTIETSPVVRITGHADVCLRDGRVVPVDGLFTMARTVSAGPLAAQLGCVLTDGPLGPYIHTNLQKATTTAGVFACGDAAQMFAGVAFAVAAGGMAGAASHQSLIFGATAADIPA